MNKAEGELHHVRIYVNSANKTFSSIQAHILAESHTWGNLYACGLLRWIRILFMYFTCFTAGKSKKIVAFPWLKFHQYTTYVLCLRHELTKTLVTLTLPRLFILFTNVYLFLYKKGNRPLWTNNSSYPSHENLPKFLLKCYKNYHLVVLTSPVLLFVGP